MPWSIGANTFDELHVSECRVEKSTGGRDSAELIMERSGTDAAPFDVDEDLEILTPESVTFFRGIVRVCTPVMQGDAEVWRLVLDGRFSSLDEIPLLQPRACAPVSDPDGDPVVKYDSLCVLGWSSSGVRQNTAEIITDVLTYAATQDSNLSTGSILATTDITVPQMEVRDAVCSEAIRSVLRWHPDAVLYYDHSSGQVNVKRPGALSTVTKAATGDSSECVRLDVAPRVIRKVRGVRIFWRVTSTVDGVEFVNTVEDPAGTTSGRRVVSMTIDLNGSQTTTQNQEIVAENIPEILEDVTTDWLMANIPELASTGIDFDYCDVAALTQTVMEDEETGPGTTLSSYPRQLIKGQVQPWMAGISACPVVITVKLRFKAMRTNNPALYDLFKGGAKTLDFTVRVMGTDASTKTYTTMATVAGESPPTGLAEDYYAALNTDWPEGSATFESEEVMDDIFPGVKLSLTGDKSVTGALVQHVSYDVMQGRTVVQFGPAGRLDPNDLVELMRAGARSRPVVNGSGGFRTSATPSGGAVIRGATGARQTNTTRVHPERKLHPFEVTVDEIGETTVTVRIAAGVLHSSYGITASAPVEVADPVRSYDTAEGTVSGVVDGDIIWVKLSYDKTFAAVVESDTKLVTIGSTSYAYRTQINSLAYECNGIPATTPYVASATRPASENVNWSDPETGGDPCVVYAKIAKVNLSGGVVTIQQYQTGPIPAPMIPLVYAVEPFFEEAD